MTVPSVDRSRCRSARRPAWRRVLTAVVGLSVTLAAAGLPTAWPSDPVGAVPAQTALPRIDLVSQVATVPEDGTFLLTAALLDAPAAGEVRITLHREPVRSRNEFSRSLFGVDVGGARVQIPSIDVADVVADDDGARVFNVAIALRRAIPSAPGQLGLSLGLRGPGVYPLSLALFDEDGRERTKLITHLVRLPAEAASGDADDAEQLRVAPLLAIDAPPTVDPTGTDIAGPATFAPARAVAAAMAAVPSAALTLDPTPETLEAMARHSEDSRSTLGELRDHLRGRQVIDGPYVSVPVTSWLNAGMDDELNRQRDRGNRIVADLDVLPDSSTWVAANDLTSAAAARLWELGVRRLVVRPEAVATAAPNPDEPTLARPFQVSTTLASRLAAVMVDTSLQAAFTRQTDPELTVMQMLAELSVIQGEAPAAARGVVLTPPAGWEPDGAFLTALLSGLDDHPLLRTATLDDLFRDVRQARVPRPTGSGDGTGSGGGTGTGPAGTPLLLRLTPLPAPSLGRYPADLAGVRAGVASYGSMVGTDDPLIDSWDQRLLLSGSSHLDPDESHAYLAAVDAVLRSDVEGIEAPDRQTVTLTAREGNVPLTIRSRLDRPVQVVLLLDSNSRLEFPDGERVAQTLQPGSQQIQIRVRARSPGDTPLTVRVSSPDDGLELTSSRITVRSTAVSGLGYVLSGGAALFLLVWWARHWRRARRNPGPPAGPSPGSGPGPDTGPSLDEGDPDGATSAPELVSHGPPGNPSGSTEV